MNTRSASPGTLPASSALCQLVDVSTAYAAQCEPVEIEIVGHITGIELLPSSISSDRLQHRRKVGFDNLNVERAVVFESWSMRATPPTLAF